ncbi:hypothetical protein SISSUDRAFT_1129685 [Sistotremastrum suecicum HHB10207 ss-3]|uniref:F-box domain-containing protein n=1 Tax=Sistotremastrum suecicum HHB10207 ss-3 TaxID=1314776 RepID=A0A166CEF3_9AGAM|nr:hypothetical protein SISSUDRAFT_1129685 [Sistotremastrum suecicum HHB10207 ss-3]
MHRFWYITELVEETFVYLSPQDLFRCALVSKVLSNTAFDFLYRDVSRVTDVLKILGPLGLMPKPEMWNAFCNSFSEDEWEYFRSYSSRVRMLKCKWGEKGCEHISDPTFLALAESMYRYDIPVFPNLRELTWHDRQVHKFLDIAIFASLSLRSFTFCIPIAQTFSQPLIDFSKIATNLNHLDVDFQSSRSKPSTLALPTFLEIIPVLRRLSSLRLPQSWIELTKLCEPLSKLSHLASLECSATRLVPNFKVIPPSGVKSFEPLESFPALYEFRFTACSRPTLVADCFTVNLVSIFVDLRGLLYPGIRPWMHDLRSTCPKLRYFAIASSEHNPDYAGGLDLSRNIFESALGLPHLRVFELHVAYPLTATDIEMERAAIAWPNLEILSLCPGAHPPISEDTVLPTLACLESFALHCPSLIHLGLHVDARIPLDGFPETTYMFSQRLERLVLASSRIDFEEHVVPYLMEHLPRTATLSLDTDARAYDLPKHFFTRQYFGNYSFNVLSNVRRKWERVASVLGRRGS